MNYYNTKPNIITPKQRTGEQRKSLIIGVVILLGLFALFVFSDAGKSKTVKPSKDDKKEQYKIIISDPTKNATAENRWLVDAQGKIDKQEIKIDETAEGSQKLKGEIEELKSSQDEKFSDLESKIELLSNKMTEGVSANNQNNGGNSNAGEMPIPQQPSITTVNFDDNGSDDLRSSSPKKQTTFNTKEGYIPQGSYVSAKIISAVDVQVGISAQSNPKPVLLRVTGSTQSAMFKGEKLSVDLEGCVITAGAIGELSSEKVYIKLSKMTCAKDGKQVTEVPIQGYVSAKGSNGVRGTLHTSGNQMSSYLIKRAEQYQPVISIPSGIDVEIVFLEGFYLDGRSKESKVKTREVAKEFEESNNNENEEEY